MAGGTAVAESGTNCMDMMLSRVVAVGATIQAGQTTNGQ